jgi:hypothetical protein
MPAMLFFPGQQLQISQFQYHGSFLRITQVPNPVIILSLKLDARESEDVSSQ